MCMLRSILNAIPVIVAGILVLSGTKALVEPSDGVAYAMFLVTVAIVVSIAYDRDLARRGR